jgi:colanic acid/amylovoran biosynthesis glycosyltransferase
MPTIAYLANQFPSPVEPYVVDEILALRKTGVEVVPCSAWQPPPSTDPRQSLFARETLCLMSSKWRVMLYGAWLCLCRLPTLWDFLARVLFHGPESPWRRWKALCHTALGAYAAHVLAGRGVHHIHVHHGYFAAWVAMVAARLLGISYSMTLHGSDLLVHDAYLDVKLSRCRTCFTVSEYNRKYILTRFPALTSTRVVVQRLGVTPPLASYRQSPPVTPSPCFVLLSVGRLHWVKNHAFLIKACSLLKERGLDFICLIAGEGPERANLQRQIELSDLKREVKLLGHVSHETLEQLYPIVDLVILTSHSEGIPLTLMEAMVCERVVLAPGITGIPELVIDGETGFLYPAGSITAFVQRVETIHNSFSRLTSIRNSARRHVMTHFNQAANLENFTSTLVSQIPSSRQSYHAHPVLQQI